MGGAATHPLLKPHCHQTSASHHQTDGERRDGGRSNLFTEGSLVEVRTNEADFRDTFFSATVISPAKTSLKKGSKKKSGKILVEYHSLLDEKDGSEKLKEYVDFSCVRPFPALQEIVEGFDQDDAVDALYQEGWWIGVVKRLVEGGERKYVVTFQNPPDEREFWFSELRVHWDWINGSWVRPDRQSIAGLMFDVGRKVEVSFERGDFQDAWFPTTIQQDLGNGVYLVEYCGEISDKEVQTLKVDSTHIRPCPPLLKVKNFLVLEKVDAFFDFGWWSGVITKVLENSRYMVFFRPLNMEKEFNQSELRSHMDWKDGKWFTSSQVVPIPSSDGGMHESYTCENSSASLPTVPVNNLGDGKDTIDENTSSSLTLGIDHFEQLTPDSHKASRVKYLTKRRRQHLSDSRNSPSQSLKKLKEVTVRGANQQEIHDKMIKEMLNDSVSPVSGNNVKTTGKQSATGDHTPDNPSWAKRTRRRQRDVGGKINSPSSYMKNINQVENLELDVGGKEPDVVDMTAEDSQNDRTKDGIENPVVVGLPCAEMVISGFAKSRGKRSRSSNSKEVMNVVSEEKQQLHDSTIQKNEDKLMKLGEFTEKRKRGRPRRISTESIQTPVTDDLNKKDDDPKRISEVEAIVMGTSSPIQEKTPLNKEKPTNGQSDPKDREGILAKRTSPRKHEKKVVKESIRPEETHVVKRGKSRSTSEKVALEVQDSHGASGGKTVDFTPEVNNVVCEEAPSNEFENQPLSKWIEGMQSPPSPWASAVTAVEQCIENRQTQIDSLVLEEVNEKHQETEIQSLPFEKNTNVVLEEVSEKHQETEIQNLPFEKTNTSVVLEEVIEKHQETEIQSLPFEKTNTNVVLEDVSEKHQETEIQSLPFEKKNTFLWKTIESMEVFQKLPQNPHFQPLENIKESLREGKAIGHMVNFSSAVEKTCNLQFDDPKTVTDDILETLGELEKHGFNVRGVQDRVAELLALREKEEKLADEAKGLNDEILARQHEKDKIEEEREEINEEIRKLQEKLLLIESAKDKKADEIASLGVGLKEAEEGIKNMRREFEGIVSSTF